jgi:hypothetical protein
MAASKGATPEVAVEQVEQVSLTEDTPAEAPQELAPVVRRSDMPRTNPLLSQERKEGIPHNTWTLWYGGLKFDCVQGVPRMFPVEVYNYLKKQGNLLPPNF